MTHITNLWSREKIDGLQNCLVVCRTSRNAKKQIRRSSEKAGGALKRSMALRKNQWRAKKIGGAQKKSMEFRKNGFRIESSKSDIMREFDFEHLDRMESIYLNLMINENNYVK